MRSFLSAVLLFFSLGLLVGHAQSKAHLPEAKTDTIPVKATDTIPVKVADTIPVKTSDSLPLQVRDSLPNKLPDSTKVLTKADSLKLLVKKMAGREAIKIDTIRITIKDVALDVNYVMIISTNAGLWAYNIGDTVKIMETRPLSKSKCWRLVEIIERAK